MSIRLKLTLWYSAVSSCTLVVFSLVIYTFLYFSMVQEIDRELSGRAVSVVRSIKIIGPTLLSEQKIVLPDVDVFGYPNTYLQVVDTNGRLMAKSSSLAQQGLPMSEDTIRHGLNGNSFYEWVQVGKQRVRIYNYPLVTQDRVVVGLLQVGQPFSGIEAALVRLRWLLWLVGGLMILVAGSIGWGLARVALRPVEEITRTAAKIRQELSFNQRIAHNGPNDELGHLVATLNSMLDSLESSYQELSESHAAQRRFVGDVSHELRTPLTTIRGNVELLRRMGDEPSPMRGEALADIASEAERMSRLVQDMLVLARADAGFTLELQPVLVEPLLQQVGRQARMLAGALDFTVEMKEDCSQALVMADADYFKQLLLILLENAFKFTTPPGQVGLTAQCGPEYVEISVTDTGMGVETEEQRYIFDRFFRSDKARPVGGTGLGLSIAHWIAEQHHAKIILDSSPGQGSTFKILLPSYGSGEETGDEWSKD
ncbi:sensor histidine kinase [Desulforamulus ruminis]|uniref:histidine kinase n=1 Tax=Desulforamulus ruminis (strain ATCC 23193 / DSM 2154 / NCIMB 8452 / DL) TaxID=696281 RepID=F6DUY9_DESRL|nr:HAMP domain-containing sensor histidine kinase [Desulforamulus ruminis]AEG61386.1 ATP-binding region ATPase domain protein [Desulforamulus ruminis DSM 2154]